MIQFIDYHTFKMSYISDIFGWVNASSNLLKMSVFDKRLDPLVPAVQKKKKI